jgi:hypothetical protein
MSKKIIIISMMLLSILAFSNSASAVFDVSEPDYYSISGNLALKADFKNWVTATVTLPKVQNFDEFFVFYGDGEFQGYLIYTLFGLLGDSSLPYPTWDEDSRGNFVVDLSDLASGFEDSLSQLGVDVTATKDPSITGKVDSRGNISGKMNLGWYVSIDASEAGLGTISGTITATSAFKGTPVYLSSSFSLPQDKNTSSRMAIQKVVGDFITSIKNQLPKKQQ